MFHVPQVCIRLACSVSGRVHHSVIFCDAPWVSLPPQTEWLHLGTLEREEEVPWTLDQQSYVVGRCKGALFVQEHSRSYLMTKVGNGVPLVTARALEDDHMVLSSLSPSLSSSIAYHQTNFLPPLERVCKPCLAGPCSEESPLIMLSPCS